MVSTGTGARAAASRESAATAALVSAFIADPAARWVWPDPQQYLEHFPAFVEAFGGKAFVYGSAQVAEGGTAAALWLPPGVEPAEDELSRVLATTSSPAIRADLFEVFERMGSYHPAEPHWYLPLIGVDPAQQGRGLGSELLGRALQRVDEDGLPAFLESSNPRNISLYQRHGFEPMGTILVGSSPPIVPMLRPGRRR